MAELKEMIKNDTCLNKADKNQSLTVLSCAITYDNDSSPQVGPTAEPNTFVDFTLLDSLQEDSEDCVILSEPEKPLSSSIMSLTSNVTEHKLPCRPTTMEVADDCVILSESKKPLSSSNLRVKSNVTKHKLPFTATTVNSEGCSPCKISKVESQEAEAGCSFLNSTITNGYPDNERNFDKNKLPFTATTISLDGCSPCKISKVKSQEAEPITGGSSSCKISIVESQDKETITNGSTLNCTITSGNLENKRSKKNKISQKQTTACLKNPQIYYQVLDMFPNVEHNYLNGLCNQESDLNQIINILLENDDYPRGKDFENNAVGLHSDMNVQIFTNSLSKKPTEITHQDCEKTVQKESVSNKTNVQLEFLIQILPDADRSFLESKSKLEENKLRDFIYEALETKTYPKQEVRLDEKVESSSNDEELGLFTTAFNIEKFLTIFPDPVQYFMDTNRKCQYSGHAVEFLKRGFRYQSMKVIDRTYKKLEYNLSRTFEALEKEKPTRNTKRTVHEIKMPKETNLVFLQEACFVEHKAEIESYLNNKSEAKKLEYEQAKDKGELIECNCCFDQCLFEDCATCNEGDLFCKSCVKKSSEVRIGDGLNTFPCLLDCGAEFSLHLLQNLLDANIFSRLIKRIQLEEVRAADIEGLEVCPFCEFATIPPPDTNIFTCLNPECLKESCRKCHKVSHIPQRCEEIEDDDQARARKYIENEMTKALVRECYKCKKSFIKMDGCNKMTCTCGAKMCYICRQPIKDYDHFNGPGGAHVNKCPLYSSDKVLHVDAVKAVAKQALKNITTTNPSIKLTHDPTKVLPTAAKSTLPPGVQENAVDLVQRLNQINRCQRAGQLRPQPMHPNLQRINNNYEALDAPIQFNVPLNQLQLRVPQLGNHRPPPFVPNPPFQNYRAQVINQFQPAVNGHFQHENLNYRQQPHIPNPQNGAHIDNYYELNRRALMDHQSVQELDDIMELVMDLQEEAAAQENN